jgi:hypothetical protein
MWSLGHHGKLLFWGSAPTNQDSRNFRGNRRIRGGRRQVRTVLYVSMLSAIQYDPDIKPVHERLVAVGQPKKGGASDLYAQAANNPWQIYNVPTMLRKVPRWSKFRSVRSSEKSVKL